MSAFGGKADIAQTTRMSAFDPKRTSVGRRTAGGAAPRNKRRSFAAFAFTGRGLSWPPQMPGQRQLSLREADLPQILPILPLPPPRTDASVRHISYKCVSRRVPCAWRRHARMRRIRSLAAIRSHPHRGCLKRHKHAESRPICAGSGRGEAGSRERGNCHRSLSASARRAALARWRHYRERQAAGA